MVIIKFIKLSNELENIKSNLPQVLPLLLMCSVMQDEVNDGMSRADVIANMISEEELELQWRLIWIC